MKRLIVLLAALLALVSAGIAPSATAAMDFNVGDRVEADVMCINRWEAGVIIYEDDQAYVVRLDPVRPGMPMGEYTMPKSGCYLDAIRPSNKPLPPDQKPDNRKPTGILDCPITEGIYGKKLPVETAKKMVRCLSEYFDDENYASRVDIKGFKIGKPRKWQPYNDIGPGTTSTLVYPIRVTATQLWWTSSTVQEQRWLKIYDCYYSTLDEWMCGLSQRIKEWPSVTRPRI